MSTLKLCMLALVLALIASVGVFAAQTQTSARVGGLPHLTITTQAQTATVLATDDTSSPNKLCHVVSCTTVDGYPFVLLVRLQKASNGLFLDVIGEATIGELTTRVNAMAITGGSHPSPSEDAIDTAVLADAAD